MTSKTDEMRKSLRRIRRAAAPAVEDGTGIYYAGGKCKVCGGDVYAYSQHVCSGRPAMEDAPPYHTQLCTGTGCTECAHLAGEDATPRTPLRDALEELILKWRGMVAKHGYGKACGQCADALEAALRAATPQPPDDAGSWEEYQHIKKRAAHTQGED
jgi:hypothetical protein